MKLEEIKQLDEYYKGGLIPQSRETILGFLPDAKQQRYHIVTKNEGHAAFIYRHDFGPKDFCYIFLGWQDKEYFGYCFTTQVSPDMVQISDIYLEPKVRGIGFARHIYAFISAVNNSYVINSKQLSDNSEKLWLGFKDRKIYNVKTKEFFELSDVDGKTVIDPKDDIDEDNQTWFYVYKERPNILRAFENLDSHFNYDRFLAGGSSHVFEETGKSFNSVPMTRCYLTEEEREEEYNEFKKQRKFLNNDYNNKTN